MPVEDRPHQRGARQDPAGQLLSDHDGGRPGGPGRWAVYLVDLPGYGYARGGDDAAAELAAIAEEYYEARAPLSATMILVDSRHPGLRADLDAVEWLNRLDVTYHDRRHEDRQAVAQRAREEPEDTRNNVWNGRLAGIGNERRRNG